MISFHIHRMSVLFYTLYSLWRAVLMFSLKKCYKLDPQRRLFGFTTTILNLLPWCQFLHLVLPIFSPSLPSSLPSFLPFLLPSFFFLPLSFLPFFLPLISLSFCLFLFFSFLPSFFPSYLPFCLLPFFHSFIWYFSCHILHVILTISLLLSLTYR